jgi:TRAP-type C4-dicarboxylate transport system substrate-binding protein
MRVSYLSLALDGKHYMVEHTRRKYLASVGIASVATLAGCSGDGNGNGNGNGDSTGTLDEEEEYTMRLAIPISLDNLDVSPMNVRGEYSGGNGWVGNIENETNGRIQVEVFDGGELGAGQELAANIQQGSVHLAHVSLANLSPFAPQLDMINLPYILGVHTDPNGLTQNWFDLHTSSLWEETINQPVRENGLRPYYWGWGPRALMANENVGAVRVPADMEGVTHRTPGSELLNKMWEMSGANPVPVDWGETAQALEEGVADTMHPSPRVVPFGFQEVISDISFLNIVEDASAFAMSQTWYEDLPEDLQEALDQAAHKTKMEAVEFITGSRENAQEVYKEYDINTHYLEEDELAQWEELISWELTAWDSEKEEFGGGEPQIIEDLVSAMEENESEFQIE